MENTENTAAALGLDAEGKEFDSSTMWFALLMMLFAQGQEPPRERELAERVAYLSGKVDTLERFLSGP